MQRDPHDIKQQLMDEYRTSIEEMGGSVNAEELERIAVSDLQIYDKVQAEQAAAAPRNPVTRDSKIPEYELEKGVKIFKSDTPLPDAHDSVLSATPASRGPKFEAMMRRISQIIRLHEGETKRDPYSLLSLNENPKLAREAISETVYYRQPGIGGKHNPYRDMNDRDRSRKYIRRLEDICDRSTAYFGPWWIR